MKPVSPTWPPSWFEVVDLHVVFTQWGLGCYERYLDGAGDHQGGGGPAPVQQQQRRPSTDEPADLEDLPF